MRVVVQRVKQAEVRDVGEITGQIETGLLILAGFEEADQVTDLEWMAQKLVKLRVFPDDQGTMMAFKVDDMTRQELEAVLEELPVDDVEIHEI